MSLIELIAGVEAHEATLTVFNADPGVAEDLAEYFSDRNIRIESAVAPDAPDSFTVLARDGAFVAAVPVSELLPEYGPDGDGRGADAGSDGSPQATPARPGKPILDHLDETMFTSYSRADMVAASREIEDRAWRVGRGELHAGFQTLDVLTGETRTYDRLGEKPDLEVHAYAVAEGDAPTPEHFTVHIERTPEIRETWFVAFDGGGVDEAKCALLAEERESGKFYGFWSYDPSTVDYMIDYLTERYGSPENSEGDGDSAVV
ncbi:DICT sensory domain-containing protein [Halorubrum vacuolatum]|uniref:Diguanylate Cyclase and Two-component system sensory domain-containing protein n=1 Tax=Halorubrum vacuolatum TaxID=63740 RepID=A0A238X1A3_HALVU|nr:DICT sensory domain-containing protein [Halorubrum vacuolatum]SNR51639.1 Diguanylate Cyclase and Two-component system sensory domain-containing protein [Halorubrum vacuolatum]